MSYKALYRTYRPSTFDQVAGQQHIVRTLSNAFKENKIAHAYLFCGPRGTGKTSLARLFAKSLNCEKGFGCQCNSCSNCLEIINGSHPDVIEIDAASNRGIDDIRDLISKVKYSPTLGKYKVYIIDEVHMMTPEAFNALLKTLEEPPSNVIFILCTTEPYKVMPTILSRVQRYDFNKVSDKDIYNNLAMICEKENIIYEDDALRLIVSLSDGGVRDSLSLLDQAIAYSGSKLCLHHVQELYGLSSLEEKIELIKTLNNNDIKFFTSKLASFIEHGIDIKRLTTDLIDIVKDLLIYLNTKDESILKVLSKDIANECKISRENLYIMLDNLLNAYSQYRYVSNISSILEIALLKIASQCNAFEEKQMVTVDEKKQKKEEEKPTQIITSVVEIEPKKPEITSTFKNIEPFAEVGTPYKLSEEDTINLMQQGNKQDKQNIIEKWALLDNYIADPTIGKYCSLLKHCSPRIASKNILVLETNFTNICNKVNFVENQPGFSALVKAISGLDYIILCLTTSDCISRVQKFSNLRQANRLPEIYPINIVLTKATALKSTNTVSVDKIID
ncbi:MAG: DNA polymerase III subunit gamma/tau [Bacillales bacterium]|nr:DNA polymerase III subunit gamma/tau [Bacillales bacterium]